MASFGFLFITEIKILTDENIYFYLKSTAGIMPAVFPRKKLSIGMEESKGYHPCSKVR